MATEALPPVRTHRRAFFGFFDADGWWWASAKALFWFVFIIVFLGYIPDRAYYFTVGRTVEIDAPVLLWSPVNLCPAENFGLPCPPPAGALVPWQATAAELALPAPRTGGVAAQLGTHLLYIGGSDGNAATTNVYQSAISNGTVSTWSDAPALPEARTDFGATTLSGVAYVIGGLGPDGKPTNTVWALPTTGDKGDLGTWAPVKDMTQNPATDLTLPEARSGAAVIAVTDGLLVAGGTGPDGKPTATVWKSTVDSKGNLGPFVEQAPLFDGVADAGSALVGEYVWIWGGTDAKGPTAAVQIAHFGAPDSGPAAGSTTAPGSSGAAAPAASQPAPSSAASAAPGASAPPVVQGVQQWASGAPVNLPAARTGAASFAANGTIYTVGGSDGKAPQSQLYWAVPDANGNLPNGWQHLDLTDLPGGLVGGSSVVVGSNVLLIGGQTQGGLLAAPVRASLAPQAPFFQLGLFGAVIPALQIPGEIGQQLGYLAAAGAATADFFVMVLLGWAFNHKAVVRGWVERRRNRARH